MWTVAFHTSTARYHCQWLLHLLLIRTYMSTISYPFLALVPSHLCLHTTLHAHLSPFLYLPFPQLDTERSASRDLRQRLESTERATAEKMQEDGRVKAEQTKQRNYQTAKATEQVWWRKGLAATVVGSGAPMYTYIRTCIHSVYMNTYVHMHSCVHWLRWIVSCTNLACRRLLLHSFLVGGTCMFLHKCVHAYVCTYVSMIHVCVRTYTVSLFLIWVFQGFNGVVVLYGTMQWGAMYFKLVSLWLLRRCVRR